MRRLLLVLSLLLVLLAPWRLIALTTEALWMSPGLERERQTNTRYWDVQDLEQRLRRLGWTVSYERDLMKNSNAFGITTFWDRRIQIDSALSWDERYTVLAHEAGHTLQPLRLTEQQAEVFAESVSLVLCHDGVREHARYLANLKADLIPTLLVYWPEVYRAADTLHW